MERFITPARVEWRDRRPYSLDHEDVFFAADGPEETRRVLIEPTDFAPRVRVAGSETHTVAELGFGTGLNFAVTAASFIGNAHPTARLHYVAVDRAPLPASELQRLLANFDLTADGEALLQQLARHYPPFTHGWHRRHLAGGRITLSLFWGDVDAALADLSARQSRGIDTWFLDGFAPDRNPSMWAQSVVESVAALSAPDAHVATFTAVGGIRRALQDVGFGMRRVDQMPQKLHSLAGRFRGRGRRHSQPGSVTIAGAGFAGASAARHLADRGFAVAVYDPSGPAGGASGLPATVLHGRLLGDGSVQAALRHRAFDYGAAYLALRPGTDPIGALQQAGANRTAAQLESLAERYAPTGSGCRWLEPSEVLERDPLANPSGGLWFPQAAVITGRTLVPALLDHPGISIIQQPAPARVDDPLVLANGSAARDHAATKFLELTEVAGQVDRVRLQSAPPWARVGAGYVAPLGDGDCIVGATYEYKPWDADDATAHNLARLTTPAQSIAHYRATRAVASDRMPIAGAVFDRDQCPVDGLWLSTGHGSMGATTSHICGDLIASRLAGEIPAMSAEEEAAITSLRFRQRQRRRGFRHGAHE